MATWQHGEPEPVDSGDRKATHHCLISIPAVFMRRKPYGDGEKSSNHSQMETKGIKPVGKDKRAV